MLPKKLFISSIFIIKNPFFFQNHFYTAVPAISPRNRHQPASKGTLRYIHSIAGPE